MTDALLTMGKRSSEGHTSAFLLWERYPEAIYQELEEDQVVLELAAEASRFQRWDRASGNLIVREAPEETCFIRVTDPLLGYHRLVTDGKLVWRTLDTRYISTIADYPIQSVELEAQELPRRIIQLGGLVIDFAYDLIRETTSDVVDRVADLSDSEQVRGFESYAELPEQDAQALVSTGGFEAALREVVNHPRQVARFRYVSHRMERPLDVLVWESEAGEVVQLQAPSVIGGEEDDETLGDRYATRARREEIKISGSNPDVVRELQERVEGEPA